ncbi:M28 family peptidase [Silvanigrella aquatica]|uniref:Peptidase M28 domain-containing protein n=1 Tax=Silvanigrella aquatica TaxID=1915309 RepID=A0A1L4CZG7_9BACT|nr:M28 family peptidase [Silvanigrella aquatica]APJ03341.1 hypothetical protein AXG55_05250 [Silvanigrella aquatica]
MKRTSCFWTIIYFGLVVTIKAFSAPLSFQNSASFSTENLQKSMTWFTAEPHPMGSQSQSKIASDLRQTLNKFGWEAKEIPFQATIPNFEAVEFGGTLKKAPQKKQVVGKNIIAIQNKNSKCSIVIGGHYDTKYFKELRFVGANDGGSSTVLMMELARVLKKTKFNKESWGSCNIILSFFDGEEAFLKDWNEGKFKINLQDNLYGSRHFAEKILQQKNNLLYYEKYPINLILILDMIGHKNQKLSITQGSDENLGEKFVNSAKNVDIKQVAFMMEDDHTPFLSLNTPLLHIIDWNNIDEWHTKNDTPHIISYEMIANLGETIIQFLKLNRN